MMSKIILAGLTFCLLSCSGAQIQRLTAKKADITFEKTSNFNGLSKYVQDAIFLSQLVEKTYPRLYTKIPKDLYKKSSEEFISDAASVKDNLEFENLAQKFMAQLKDGHTAISLSLYREKKLYPVYFYKEKQNWKVFNISKTIDSSVVGSRIVSINDIPISEVEKKVENFNSGENSFYRLADFRFQIQLPKYLEAIGLIDSEKPLKISTERNDKNYTFELTPSKKRAYYKVRPLANKYPITDKKNDGFYIETDQKKDFAYLQMNTCLDLVVLKDGIGNYTNFITRPLAMLYLKSQYKDARNFGKTLQSLFMEVNAKNINNLIIDLRYNTGGDERLGKQLIWYLTESDSIRGFTEYIQVSEYFKEHVKNDYKYYNQLYKDKYGVSIPKGEIDITSDLFPKPFFFNITAKDDPFLLDENIPKFKGKVYVLIGNTTFSAGQILATTLADNNLATIVGKPTGNKPSTQTGASGFKLPKTKTLGTISYSYMERPNSHRNEEDALYPDIETYATFETWLAGNDVSFDSIMNEISKQNEKN